MRKETKALDPEFPVIVIYDGQCPVCNKTIAWILEYGKEGAFETLPCQAQERRERFPLMTESACMEAIQVVLPDGRILSGEQALPEIVKRLKNVGAASDLFSLPGADVLTRSFYRWFARNRYGIADILFPGKKKKGRHA